MRILRRGDTGGGEQARLNLWYNARMKLMAQVKLLPTLEKVNALHNTLERANTAYNFISQHGLENRTFRQYDYGIGTGD